MHPRSRFAAQIVALTLLVSGFVIGTTGPAVADAYDPPAGVKLSAPIKSPYGNYVIFNHLLRTINSVPRGEKIRIASWNIRSDKYFRALVGAHKRGVSVQIVVDVENANDHMEFPNPGFFWMQKELRQGNTKRKAGYRSYAKVCYRSCRGKYGIAHAKYFLFSKSYHTKYVVMYGSFNATDLAAQIQWNDMYTVTGRKNLYQFAMQRWAEAAQDKPVANAWKVDTFGPIRWGLFPYIGEGATGDPVIRVLNGVKCTGVTGAAGKNGRTVIRIAQTSQAYERGEKIARKLKALWNEGCDIRMLSAIYGDRDRAIYRAAGPRGPMPFRQIAQDFDGDGLYDRYMHTKFMTISGNWNGVTDAQYAWNGSGNWERYVLSSDDTFVRIQSPNLVKVYSDYVNYWWEHVPPKPKVTVEQQLRILSGQVDPYQNIEVH